MRVAAPPSAPTASKPRLSSVVVDMGVDLLRVGPGYRTRSAGATRLPALLRSYWLTRPGGAHPAPTSTRRAGQGTLTGLLVRRSRAGVRRQPTQARLACT